MQKNDPRRIGHDCRFEFILIDTKKLISIALTLLLIAYDVP